MAAPVEATVGVRSPLLVVLSEPDPVARALGACWGLGEPTGEHVDGTVVRRLADGPLVLHRAGVHLHDERLDLRLPTSLRDLRPTLLFASIHRSESGSRCFTVHPLGNPNGSATLGGRPRTLVPTDPRAMAGLVRAVDERARPLGLPTTYEATHHGPEVGLPALFAEIAVPEGARPSDEEVAVLAAAIRGFVPDPSDRVALAAGGGHYAPHFTDLACSRRWAFGHILSRHALGDLEPGTARQAFELTAGAQGIVYARAQDRGHPALDGIGPTLRDADAPRREEGRGRATSGDRPASGT